MSAHFASAPMRRIGLAALASLVGVFMVWLLTGPIEDPEQGVPE